MRKKLIFVPWRGYELTADERRTHLRLSRSKTVGTNGLVAEKNALERGKGCLEDEVAVLRRGPLRRVERERLAPGGAGAGLLAPAALRPDEHAAPAAGLHAHQRLG